MSEGPKEYRRNVAAVVVDAEGRVLLGRKNATSRFLHFPQGGVGHKETFEQALWRELAEETGLTSQHLQIVARVGGLCYHYRKKNKKSKIWAGQQQTYYLLRCTQADVAADATRSAEFSSLEWVPFRELSPEMFVSFKREVAEEVLELFFPRRVEDLAAYWQQLNVASRYEFGPDSALAAFSAQERSLFLGGKEEARPALEDLRKRIRAAQRKWESMPNPPRILVLITDGEPVPGKRSINCLRHAADLPDPFHIRVLHPFVDPGSYQAADKISAADLLPPASACLLTADSAYRTFRDDADVQPLLAAEQQLLDARVHVLKLYLHITAAQFEKMYPEASGSAYADYLARAERRLQRTASPVPWYIIPSEKKWYRDWIIGSLLASLVENATTDASAS